MFDFMGGDAGHGSFRMIAILDQILADIIPITLTALVCEIWTVRRAFTIKQQSFQQILIGGDLVTNALGRNLTFKLRER